MRDYRHTAKWKGCVMIRSRVVLVSLLAAAVLVGFFGARSALADPIVTIEEVASCDDATELIRCAPYSLALDADGSYSQVFHNNLNETISVFGVVMDTQTTMWSSDGGDYFTYEFFAGDNGVILLPGAAGTGIPHCTCFRVTITGGAANDKGEMLACPYPEPASIAYVFSALVAGGVVRRRRVRSAGGLRTYLRHGQH